MSELRRLASQGIPDGAGVRSSVWKVFYLLSVNSPDVSIEIRCLLMSCNLFQLLLGYLPSDRALWPSEVAKKRSQYKDFKDELLMNPVSSTSLIKHLFFDILLQFCNCYKLLFKL